MSDMDPPPMILPKGIVFNIDRVYKEVANYTTVPPEKIYEYWHVYTTTFGRLKDPTANRLENFWWHVMGSDRRSLSGPTLARLFEQISNGPTFVPLKGPPNRYEGPSRSNMPKDLAAAMQLHKLLSGQQTDDVQDARRPEAPKVIASSSSKPPPSHPILKKPRGPSASGPRPTARFISPAGSDEESDRKESEESSSTSAVGPTANQSKSTGNSTSKEKHKKPSSVAHRKKAAGFVASSASKRRPAMPRRQSSQSSATGSEVGSREERSSVSMGYNAPQRPVSPIAERPSKSGSTRPQDEGERISAKASGKRPSITATGSSDPGKPKHGFMPQERPTVSQVNARSDSSTGTDARDSDKESVRKANQTKDRAAKSHRLPDPQEQIHPEAVPATINRTGSDVGAFRTPQRETKPGRRGPPQGLLSTSTATTSNVAAQGTIIEFDENTPARAAANALQEDFSETGLRRSGSAVTLTPTAPSTTPSVPLGRSKSQLTLLLERQGDKRSRR